MRAVNAHGANADEAIQGLPRRSKHLLVLGLRRPQVVFPKVESSAIMMIYLRISLNVCPCPACSLSFRNGSRQQTASAFAVMMLIAIACHVPKILCRVRLHYRAVFPYECRRGYVPGMRQFTSSQFARKGWGTNHDVSPKTTFNPPIYSL